MMHYLDPSSERAANHLKTLEQGLKAPNGLFFRYKHADDLGRQKSTFLISAFWHVEALACVGWLDEAVESFENQLKYSRSEEHTSELQTLMRKKNDVIC